MNARNDQGPSAKRNGAEKASAAPARSSTLLLTNVTKLVGVAVFVNEAVFRTTRSDAVLAVCALLVLGAQVAENVLLGLIERLLGGSKPEGK